MTAPVSRELFHWRLTQERLLEDFPELEDDQETLFDTLDGCTRLTDVLIELIRSGLQDRAWADGMKGYIDKLQQRKRWLTDRNEKKRNLVLHIMEDADIKKIEAPDMAISRRRSAVGIVITDEQLLTDKFVRIKREPDKTAIKAALERGDIVPGAELSNQAETISVRT
jgi:hypothetical protein